MYKVPYSPRGGGKFIKQFGEEYQIDIREWKRGREKGKGKGEGKGEREREGRGRGKGRQKGLGKNIKLVEGKG